MLMLNASMQPGVLYAVRCRGYWRRLGRILIFLGLKLIGGGSADYTLRLSG